MLQGRVFFQESLVFSFDALVRSLDLLVIVHGGGFILLGVYFLDIEEGVAAIIGNIKHRPLQKLSLSLDILQMLAKVCDRLDDIFSMGSIFLTLRVFIPHLLIALHDDAREIRTVGDVSERSAIIASLQVLSSHHRII